MFAGCFQEELETVAREMDIWDKLLGRLPPQLEPGQEEYKGWKDGWMVVRSPVGPVAGLWQVELWLQVWARWVFTHGVVGAERVEGIGPAHKQASLSTEQHLHEVTAFILQGRQKYTAVRSLVCRGGRREEKKSKMMEWTEGEVSLFLRLIIQRVLWNEAFQLPDV